MKALALTLALTLTGCTVAAPQTYDTWDEQWEPAPTPSPEGWQCDGQPCSDAELQRMIDALEPFSEDQPHDAD